MKISCPCGRQIESSELRRIRCSYCGTEHQVFRHGSVGARVVLGKRYPSGSWNLVEDGPQGSEMRALGANFNRDARREPDRRT